MPNLFGENLLQEEIITFTYAGDKFTSHEIEICDFATQLKGIETLIKETIEFYRVNNKLSTGEVSCDIYVRIEDGSIKEIVKVVKKNATVLALLGTFVMPFLQSGFEYYLNHRNTGNAEAIQILEDNKKIRQSFGNIIAPIGGDNNRVIINSGDVTYEVCGSDKEVIVDEIEKHEELISKKETIKEEDLIGVVSVSKVYDPSPFSFRINQTTQDLPLYFENANFTLHDRQDFLGKELAIRAKVTYKNERRISISVIEYKSINKLFEN